MSSEYTFPLDVGPMYQVYSEIPSHPMQRKVLWIGNSYTECHLLPFLVRNLSLHYGPWVAAPTFCVRGGESMAGHLKTGHAASQLALGGWHAVVLQEWSMGTYNDGLGSFMPAIKEMVGLAKAQGTEVYLYQTWARKKEPWRIDTIAAAYQKASEETGATVLPCGRAWQLLLEKRPDLTLHTEDESHPQAIGSFLAAMTQWRVIGGQAFSNCPSKLELVGRTFVEIEDSLKKDVLDAVEGALTFTK